MAALSQLSYGPEALQCSSEPMIGRPVDELTLVVPRRRQAQLNRRTSIETPHRKEIAGIEIAAVRSDQVDLVGVVVGLDVPVWPTARPATADHDDASVCARLLALHAGKAPAQVNTKSYRSGETGRETPMPSSIAAAATFDSAMAPFCRSSTPRTQYGERVGRTRSSMKTTTPRPEVSD